MSFINLSIQISKDGVKICLQIWFALTLITEIQHRVVSIRMVNVTGTAKKSAEITRQVEELAIKRLSVSQEQQQKIMDAAVIKLQAVDV